jgi:very-short-patch-repair endonuclease
MKKQEHLIHYKSSLIENARRLRNEMTDAEKKLWNCLRGNQMQLHFRRHVPFEKFILDFYCSKAKLAMEVDGGQHYTEEGVKADQARDKYLEAQGIKVLRFSDYDVLINISGVPQRICDFMSCRSLTPLPLRGGREEVRLSKHLYRDH